MFATVLLIALGAWAVVLGIALVIARFAGANERGNDDHELWEPFDDH